MQSRNVYTSVACNRTTDSADWGSNGLIVFGAGNAICIFDPKFDGVAAKITHSYQQHMKRVNTVQWLRRTATEPEDFVLSGSNDGLAILWNVTDLELPKFYALKGHERGVNAVTGISLSQHTWLLATASADCSVKLWHFDGINCKCIQTIMLNRGFCFALRLVRLPLTEQILLAFSTDDESISLWAQQEETQQFMSIHKLVGHEEWVRGLDFVAEGDDLLLASSSQDSFIRLWRISTRQENEVRNNTMDIFTVMDEGSADIRMEEKIVQSGSNKWVAISLESVLYGHEGWVYGVHWHTSKVSGLRLLSASIDKTLIIWERTEDDMWMESVRVGDVGGNSLGFLGGKFSSDGHSIMGHGYQGAFHMWTQSQDNPQMWIPDVTVGGHYDEVRDITWDPQGEYIMSVSADQTTRIHAPWRRCMVDGNVNITWHEIARPQVHGYDMQTLAILSRYHFASGAEEKIVRTFQAPANFIENFRSVVGIECDEEGDKLLDLLPKGASVPSLGLSNKAVYTIESHSAEKPIKDEYPENYFVPTQMEKPPQEETLMQNTLWPETHKLYGHGYEISALAASSTHHVLASACRSSNAEHAGIILWNTSTWKQYQRLSSHQLTVTQLRFSPNGHYLLSVSRDRRWTLFEVQEVDSNDVPTYKTIATTDKKNGVHSRIIWSCDWSHDSKYFVTSSREGKVVIWTFDNVNATIGLELNGWKSLEMLELKGESVTAVAFAPNLITADGYMLALGLESGLIKIYRFDGKWTLLLELNNDLAHHLTVRRLQFRPVVLQSSQSDIPQFYLASCGDDNFVRIYALSLK